MPLPEEGQAADLTPEQADWHLLVLLSGPSGVGKGTIGARLLQLFPHLILCSSATTRGPEPRDREGEYLYSTMGQFVQMWEDGKLLEVDGHFDRWYGLKHPGKDAFALSDVDVKGSMRMYRAGQPRLLRIAILPPGETVDEMIDTCTSRMESSRTDADGIAKRRDRITEEVGIIQTSWRADPDARIVVNDNLDMAVFECQNYIDARLARLARS